MNTPRLARVAAAFCVLLLAPNPLLATPAKVDPLVLGLRDALYADASLEELADQLSILPAVEQPIALVHAGRSTEALKLLENRPDRDAFVPVVARIFAYHRAGNRARGLALTGNLIRSPDSRIALQGYRIRRELDSSPLANVRLNARGALVEFGDRDRPLVVAGYADGQARLYYRDGRRSSDQGDAVQASARSLVSTVGARSRILAPERSRNLPGPGQVRLVFLTPESILVQNVARPEIEKAAHPLAPAYRKALALIKAMQGAHKKPDR